MYQRMREHTTGKYDIPASIQSAASSSVRKEAFKLSIILYCKQRKAESNPIFVAFNNQNK